MWSFRANSQTINLSLNDSKSSGGPEGIVQRTFAARIIATVYAQLLCSWPVVFVVLLARTRVADGY